VSKSSRPDQITVLGAGVIGLWQALRLARAGFAVRVMEASPQPFTSSASRLAGAMLAPDCEAESAPEIIRDLGRTSVALWRTVYPQLIERGTLVLASARDRHEIARHARLTERHRALDGAQISELEPHLADRFQDGLLFPDEAHMPTLAALQALLDATRQAGCTVSFGHSWHDRDAAPGLLIDCRGIAARRDLASLRGVRGERLLVRTPDVTLSRPVRLLHPRHPLYVVPWGDGRFVIGATVIESEDDGPATIRSMLELLGAAYTLTPAFAEAEILDVGAGVRPAYPDNVPRALVHENGRRIDVNGAYRHGFLLAPVLADAVLAHLQSGAAHPLIQRP